MPASSFADIDWAKETMKVVLGYDGPPLSQHTFNISKASLRADGSYRTTVAIPADGKAVSADQWIQAVLYTVFTGENSETNRATSARMVVNDTSVLPEIISVYFSASSVVGAGEVTQVNEGDTVYIQVVAKGLTADGSNATIILTYGSTVYNDNSISVEVVGGLPTTMNVVLTDTISRIYKGVSGPVKFIEDNKIG